MLGKVRRQQLNWTSSGAPESMWLCCVMDTGVIEVNQTLLSRVTLTGGKESVDKKLESVKVWARRVSET